MLQYDKAKYQYYEYAGWLKKQNKNSTGCHTSHVFLQSKKNELFGFPMIPFSYPNNMK